MNLIFQASPWWLLACVAAGVTYAGLMYQPLPGKTIPGGWDKRLNYGLAALRFVV
ncbi:MAG: hypothetical protein H7Z72_17140, partial [Bacteroidetes bacterium]|nr:hypothetical protein [Fibrella sp.]